MSIVSLIASQKLCSVAKRFCTRGERESLWAFDGLFSHTAAFVGTGSMMSCAIFLRGNFIII